MCIKVDLDVQTREFGLVQFRFESTTHASPSTAEYMKGSCAFQPAMTISFSGDSPWMTAEGV